MLYRLIVLFSLITFALTNIEATAAEYWISYTGFHKDPPGPNPGGPKFLMKVDLLGNVLLPPQKVISNSKQYVGPLRGATAISVNGRFLHMWMPDNRGNTINFPLFHAVINKKTLQLVSIAKLDETTTNLKYLQVSQKKENNFLAVHQALDVPFQTTQWYAGIPLKQNGKISGETFRVFPEGAGCLTTHSDLCSFGVSSNGRILFFRNNPEISSSGINALGVVLQRLDKSGQPVKEPVVVIKGNVIPADVSGKLGENRRFLLYQAHIRHPKLLLQVIEADALKKVGDPVAIAVFSGFGDQSAAIDPFGHFVLYITSTGNRAGDGLLMFQSLDILGRPSGPPKMIAEGVFSGLDVLKDTSTD